MDKAIKHHFTEWRLSFSLPQSSLLGKAAQPEHLTVSYSLGLHMSSHSHTSLVCRNPEQ